MTENVSGPHIRRTMYQKSMPPASNMVDIKIFLSLFLFFYFPFFYDLFIFVLYLFYCLLLLSYEKTHSDWAKVKLDDEVVRWCWFEIRGRACENGWWAHDSLWKVPAVRHLREGHGGKVTESSNAPPWPSPRCLTVGTFHRLSQAHKPLLHALPLILNHHHLTTSSSSFTFTQSDWVSS